MIISISGPTKTGKSTILSLLKDSLPSNTVYVEDLYYSTWKDLVDSGSFSEFIDIAKDRDLMYTYIYRVCSKYISLIEKYCCYDGLVVLEGCYLDYLIYMQLNTWYHYPLVSHQENLTLELLKYNDMVDKIYMTTADDNSYPLSSIKLGYKMSKAAFKRNRGLELSFYNLYNDNRKVFKLPSDTLSCDKIILDDLRSSILV